MGRAGHPDRRNARLLHVDILDVGLVGPFGGGDLYLSRPSLWQRGGRFSFLGERTASHRGGKEEEPRSLVVRHARARIPRAIRYVAGAEPCTLQPLQLAG
jgi:hypothetical protein